MMKKTFIPLSVVLLLCSFQAGAATLLTLSKTTGGTNSNVTSVTPSSPASSDTTVSGTGNIASNKTFSFTWNLNLTSAPKLILGIANTGSLSSFNFVFKHSGGSTVYSTTSTGVSPTLLSGLTDGLYKVIVSGRTSTGTAGNNTTSFTYSVPSVPVPAAVWLFGSALMGLVGVSRRKAKSSMIV